MTWIARVDALQSGTPLDLREAELTDIPSADRGNWREVDVTAPAGFDHNVEQLQRTGLAISKSGPNTFVAVTWSLVAEPALVIRMRLRSLAEAEAERRRDRGRVTVFSRQVSTGEAQRTKLSNARLEISQGWRTSVAVEDATGAVVSANAAQLDTVLQAISDYRAAVATARATVIAEVEAGTLTTSAAVTGHAAWPA